MYPAVFSNYEIKKPTSQIEQIQDVISKIFKEYHIEIKQHYVQHYKQSVVFAFSSPQNLFGDTETIAIRKMITVLENIFSRSVSIAVENNEGTVWITTQ